MNTVMTSFNTTVRQMNKMSVTKMSQQKWPKCLSEKKNNCFLTDTQC